MRGANRKAANRPGNGLFRRPHLEQLENRIVLDTAFTNLAAAVDSQLGAVQAAFPVIATTANALPILNTKFQSIAGDAQAALANFRAFLQSTLSGLDSTASAAVLQSQLFGALNSRGFLHDLNGNGTLDDLTVTRDPVSQDLHFSMDVTAQAAASTAYTFGLGLPGVPLSVRAGRLQVSAGFTYDHLTFVLHGNGTPYFDNTVGQVAVTVSAKLAGTPIRGSIGFLEVSTMPGTTATLSMAMATTVTPGGLVNPQLSGAADVNLVLQADFSTGTIPKDGFTYPYVQATLYMHWGFNNSDPMAAIGSFGTEPDIEFRNVQFGMGAFISNILSPIVNVLQDITQPLAPIISILQTSIPGLSDLSEAVNLGPVSIESLAKLVSGFLPADYQLIVDLFVSLTDLTAAINSIHLDPNNQLLVNVGSFDLAGQDIRDQVTLGLDSPNLTNLIPIALGALQSVSSQLPPILQNSFNVIANELQSAENGIGLTFPLFDDPRAGIFKLLLGQDVDFVDFTARFHIAASDSVFYPIWGPVNVRLNGTINADAYFKIGYDTLGLRHFLQSGLNAAKLIDGFYIDASQPLLQLSGSIAAGISLNAPLGPIPVLIPAPPVGEPIPIPIVPSVSINGQVSANNVSVRFNSADPKYRFLDVLPDPIFLTQGQINVGFSFVVEVGIPGIYMQTLYQKNFDQQTLLDLYNGPLANPGNPITEQPPQQQPVDVTMDLTGTKQRYIHFLPVPDTIQLSVSNGYLDMFLNGQLFQDPVPLALVKTIRVLGSDAWEQLRVFGEVDRIVYFQPGLSGLNSVTLDDSNNSDLTPQYTVTYNDVQRSSPSGTVDIQFSNVVSVQLDTANHSLLNNVLIQQIYGTSVVVSLGQTYNFVTVDTTTGGSGDSVYILGNTAAYTGLNALFIQDDDTTSSVFSSSATYTLANTYDANGNLIDTSVVRTKRQRAGGKFVKQLYYTAATTVNYSGVQVVSIKGGDLGNTFNVQSLDPHVAYSLTGGAGADIFDLGAGSGRLGLLNSNVTLDGGAGRNDQVVFDDSADDAATYSPISTWTINNQTISLQTQVQLNGYPVNIADTFNYQNIEHFLIKGGGYETFNIYDTPQVVNVVNSGLAGIHVYLDGDMTIDGGNSFDIINVYKTTGALSISPGSLYNSINVGYPEGDDLATLDTIQGAVTLLANSSVNISTTTSVFFDDGASTAQYTYVIDAKHLTRLDTSGSRTTGTIDFSASTLTDLSVAGSMGYNVFTVNDTVVGPTTNISTGSGGSTVNVHHTTGALDIGMGGGPIQQINIGDAKTSLDAMLGNITVVAGRNVDAMVWDRASTSFRSTVITGSGSGSQTIRRYTPDGETLLNTIQFGLFGTVLERLNYIDGSAGEAVNVSGNPAGTQLNLYGASGATDEFVVETDQNAIAGPVNVFGQSADNDFAFYYDYFEPIAQTYTVTATGPLKSNTLVQRTGAAPVTFSGLTEVILATASDFYTPTIVGNNIVNVSSLPAGVVLNLELDDRDQLTVGSNAPNLGGSLVNIKGSLIIGGSQANVTLDDSGNPSKIARTISIQHENVYDAITGLAPQPIAFSLDATSALNILGSNADETFSVAGAGFTPAIRIDGGGGTNTLDYSNYNGLPGLVAWYQAEGNYYDSAAGNNGSVIGNVTFVPGEVGQAFSFDGTGGYVEATATQAIDPPVVSVEAWVNSAAVAPDAYIVDKGAGATGDGSYALYTGPDGGLRFYVSDGTTTIESPDAGASLWDGNWHHVVGTYDGSTVRLYVDGTEVGSGTAANLTVNYSLPINNNLYLGTYNGQSQNAFSGLLDEVSIFNRVLSPTEIQTLAAAGSVGNSAIAQGVMVNLQAGTATELSGGISHIQNVNGSPFNDILVGNGGNVLNGGGGRNLLIAGPTASTLIGGNGDDILIGGTTTHDLDPVALEAILAVWSRANEDYLTRVAELQQGLLAAGTVTNNGGGNTLTGQGGMNLFFASLTDTGDWTENEIVVPI
jgi:hypothetical protein